MNWKTKKSKWRRSNINPAMTNWINLTWGDVGPYSSYVDFQLAPLMSSLRGKLVPQERPIGDPEYIFAPMMTIAVAKKCRRLDTNNNNQYWRMQQAFAICCIHISTTNTAAADFHVRWIAGSTRIAGHIQPALYRGNQTFEVRHIPMPLQPNGSNIARVKRYDVRRIASYNPTWLLNW